MPRKWRVSPEQQNQRAIELLSGGSINGRVESASPVRPRRLLGAIATSAPAGGSLPRREVIFTIGTDTVPANLTAHAINWTDYQDDTGDVLQAYSLPEQYFSVIADGWYSIDLFTEWEQGAANYPVELQIDVPFLSGVYSGWREHKETVWTADWSYTAFTQHVGPLWLTTSGSIDAIVRNGDSSDQVMHGAEMRIARLAVG